MSSRFFRKSQLLLSACHLLTVTLYRPEKLMDDNTHGCQQFQFLAFTSVRKARANSEIVFFSEKCACLNGNMGTNQLQNQPLCSPEKIYPWSCFYSPFSCKYNWQLGPCRILFLFHEQQRNEMQLTPWSSSQLQHTGTPVTREGVPSRDFSRLN